MSSAQLHLAFVPCLLALLETPGFRKLLDDVDVDDVKATRKTEKH